MRSRNDNAEYGYGKTLDIRGLQAYTSLGRTSAVKVGKDAGAIIRLGNRVVYDREKVDAYLNALRESENA